MGRSCSAAGCQQRSVGRLDQHLQLIDVRDLAAFALRVIEQRIPGTYNAVGPEQPITIATMIDAIQRALGVTIVLVPT